MKTKFTYLHWLDNWILLSFSQATEGHACNFAKDIDAYIIHVYGSEKNLYIIFFILILIKSKWDYETIVAYWHYTMLIAWDSSFISRKFVAVINLICFSFLRGLWWQLDSAVSGRKRFGLESRNWYCFVLSSMLSAWWILILWLRLRAKGFIYWKLEHCW